jgi:tetratricopeptide (TPR) repeat protein
MKKIVVLGLVGIFVLLIAFGWMMVAKKQGAENRHEDDYRWGDLIEIVDNSSEQITSNPNNAKLYFTRGWAYEQLGSYKEATMDYRKVLELNPHYKEAQESLVKLEKLFTNPSFITEKQALDIVYKIPEIKALCDNALNNYKNITPRSFTEEAPKIDKNGNIKGVWEFYIGEMHEEYRVLWDRIKVHPLTGEVSVWDSPNDTYIPLEKWQRRNRK